MSLRSRPAPPAVPVGPPIRVPVYRQATRRDPPAGMLPYRYAFTPSAEGETPHAVVVSAEGGELRGDPPMLHTPRCPEGLDASYALDLAGRCKLALSIDGQDPPGERCRAAVRAAVEADGLDATLRHLVREFNGPAQVLRALASLLTEAERGGGR